MAHRTPNLRISGRDHFHSEAAAQVSPELAPTGLKINVARGAQSIQVALTTRGKVRSPPKTHSRFEDSLRLVCWERRNQGGGPDRESQMRPGIRRVVTRIDQARTGFPGGQCDFVSGYKPLAFSCIQETFSCCHWRPPTCANPRALCIDFPPYWSACCFRLRPFAKPNQFHLCHLCHLCQRRRKRSLQSPAHGLMFPRFLRERLARMPADRKCRLRITTES